MASRTKILTAFLLGFLLVATAFYVSRYDPLGFNAQGPAVTSIPSKRTHIPIQDSDSDGIPDWQAELIDSEPIVLPVASSSYNYPETLTGQFGIEVFKQVLYAYNDGTLEEKEEAITNAAIATLAEKAKDELYTADDIQTVNGNDTELLKNYGNLIAYIALVYPTDIDNEMTVWKDILDTANNERTQDFEPLIEAYTNMTNQMLAASVPTDYVEEHLYLLNSYNALQQDVRGMYQLYTDPTYALVRYKRYENDLASMHNALSILYSKLYLNDNIRWDKDAPVFDIVSFDE